jgi:hypothetical protein
MGPLAHEGSARLLLAMRVVNRRVLALSSRP